jgi:hypothetical protein
LVICDFLLVICDFFLDQIKRNAVCIGNETGVWLLIMLEARMAPAVLVENLIRENRELASILGASISIAQARASRINK